MIKNILLATAAVSIMASQAIAQDSEIPTLTVTNKPIAELVGQTDAAPQRSDIPAMPALEGEPMQPQRVAALDDRSGGMTLNLYSSPSVTEDITADRVLGADYFDPVNTMASQKVSEIQNEMYGLQGEVADAAQQLQTLEVLGQDLAANYYAAVATINTQLQSGTTPGNPRLKNRLTLAEDALDTLSGNIADLNTMAVKIADLASVSNFLQQQARAAYGLSGSVEEDHVALAQLEDEISNTAVAIERLLNNVNDNITRAAAYMATERANLRTLSLAVANGDLYGKSLSSRPFSMAESTDIVDRANMTAMGQPTVQSVAPNTPRPLIKIRFDRPDVDYTQALYMSISDALQQFPNSQFELVAVSPGMGNPAKLAIESTKARRNAEKVLRNMVQMGVDTNRVNLANLTEDNIQHNEVHLYIR